jgi:hypothetical protein
MKFLFAWEDLAGDLPGGLNEILVESCTLIYIQVCSGRFRWKSLSSPKNRCDFLGRCRRGPPTIRALIDIWPS